MIRKSATVLSSALGRSLFVSGLWRQRPVLLPPMLRPVSSTSRKDPEFFKSLETEEEWPTYTTSQSEKRPIVAFFCAE